MEDKWAELQIWVIGEIQIAEKVLRGLPPENRFYARIEERLTALHQILHKMQDL